jgi:hypothetical protein
MRLKSDFTLLLAYLVEFQVFRRHSYLCHCCLVVVFEGFFNGFTNLHTSMLYRLIDKTNEPKPLCSSKTNCPPSHTTLSSTLLYANEWNYGYTPRRLAACRSSTWNSKDSMSLLLLLLLSTWRRRDGASKCCRSVSKSRDPEVVDDFGDSAVAPTRDRRRCL